MRYVAFIAVGLVLALAACGSDSGEGSSSSSDSSRTAVQLPVGCRPASVKQLLGGFLSAINRADRGTAVTYVAPNPELIGFFIALGRSAQAKRIEARTPQAVYAAFRRIADGERFSVLRAAVGSVGPFARDTRHPELRGRSTAGVDFVLGLGSRTASGKAGIDCGTGRIYLMPVSIVRGLHPARQQLCGGYVRLDADKPVVCALP